MIEHLLNLIGPEAVFYGNLAINVMVAVALYIAAKGVLAFLGSVASGTKNAALREELSLLQDIALKAINYAEENYRHKAKTLGEEVLKNVNSSDTKLRDAISLASTSLLEAGIKASTKEVEQAIKAALAASRK